MTFIHERERQRNPNGLQEKVDQSITAAASPMSSEEKKKKDIKADFR